VKIRFIRNPVNIKATVGEEVDLPDHVAKALINDGYAVSAIVRGFQDMRSKLRPEKAVLR
jgi:hypothetical protein